MAGMKVEYKTFPGWMSATTGCSTFDSLPRRAKDYVEYIEGQLGVPIKWIGTGPRRENMIAR